MRSMQAGRRKRRRCCSTSSLFLFACTTSAVLSWQDQLIGMKTAILVSSSVLGDGGHHIAMYGRRCFTSRSIHLSFRLQQAGRCVAFANNSPARSSAILPYKASQVVYTSCVNSLLPTIRRKLHLEFAPINNRLFFTTTTTNGYSTALLHHHDDDDDETMIDEEKWKKFISDELTETLILPSITVPSRHVHWLLSDKHSPLKPYLATQMVELEGVHPKIKIVRDCINEEQIDRKRILLDSHLESDNREKTTTSSKVSDDISSEEISMLELLTQQFPNIPVDILQQLITEFDITLGQSECIDIPYQHQPISRILSKILPPDPNGQPPPSSYEQIGHVAHFNLRQSHVPYGKFIGRIMLDRLQPSIRTVVNKLGEVGGPYRTYKMDLLAGDDDYAVHVTEHGVSLHFDLRNVYWCTRLEGERTSMIEREFKDNQLIADAFCGVGALCIRAAKVKSCRIVANDLNPDAVLHCKDSAIRNGIDVSGKEKFQVQCGDASQFIMNLGIDADSSSEEEGYDNEDSPSSISSSNNNLPDHLLLNFPLDSPSFLNALRWWPSSGGVSSTQTPSLTRVHVYTFARADDERTAAEVAIDMVADGLLPEGGYVEPSKFRGGYLDELGCNIQAREIRDAAPGKLVICVSFSVTRLLLRRMQGDYGLD